MNELLLVILHVIFEPISLTHDDKKKDCKGLKKIYY